MLKITSLAIGLLTAISMVPAAQAMPISTLHRPNKPQVVAIRRAVPARNVVIRHRVSPMKKVVLRRHRFTPIKKVAVHHRYVKYHRNHRR